MSHYSTQDGLTALLLASCYGHEEVVEILLKSGAVDVPDKVRMSVVHRACEILAENILYSSDNQ